MVSRLVDMRVCLQTNSSSYVHLRRLMINEKANSAATCLVDRYQSLLANTMPNTWNP